MKVKKRDEIDNQYKWRLEDIYASDQIWSDDIKKAKELSDLLIDFKGKLNNDKKSIFDCLNLNSKVGYILEKLYVYARMRLDQDVTVTKYKEMVSKVESLSVNIDAKTAFILPELSANDEEFLLSLSKDKDFEKYSYSLELIVKRKKHTLSTKEETLLAKMGKFTSLFKESFSMLDNADIKFEDFVNDKGEVVALSHGIYGLYLQTGSREERKKAFESMFNAYKQNINLITTLYKGNVEKNAFYANVRGYKSCLDRATSNEDVPSEVYERLIKNIHLNLPYLHDYMRYRKEELKYDELHMYDLHMPLVEDVTETIEYNQAKQMVLEALAPLGKDYNELLQKAFNEGWIDVYENKGKRSGAYSWGCYGTHPYVLLNYQPVLNDVFTIAHELGHAMHTYFSNENQPMEKAGYEIFVAEVASTVNETLLVMHLLKTATGNYRKYLLSYLLNMFRTTVFRQSQFAEFEYKAHTMAENEEPITPDSLCNMYYDLNKQYYGEDVVNDELIRYEWARIPHFYTAFYVYKYSTGLISAVCIACDILEKGEQAVKDYKKFLSAGGSMSPVEILKLVGVDLTTDAPYTKAMNFFKHTLEEIKLTK